MATITPEKLKDLMLKARKGATASFTIAQITAIVEALGGSVKPVLGLIGVDDHGGWKGKGTPHEVWFRSAEEQGETVSGLQKYVVSALPSKPKPGMLYVQDLEKIEDTLSYGKAMPGIRLVAYIGATGVEIKFPDGKSETIFPHRARNLRDLLSRGLQKPVLQNYDVFKFLNTTDWIARINQFLQMEEHVPSAQRTRDGTGSCPVCFQNIKISSSEMMVLHGYKRPGHGQVHGSCFGVGYPAFEVSVKGVVAYLNQMILPSIKRIQSNLDGLKSGDIKKIPVRYSKDPVTPESPDWDSALKDAIQVTERSLKAAESDKAAYNRLKDHWVERPLPVEGGILKNWFYEGQKASSSAVKLALAVRVASRFLEAARLNPADTKALKLVREYAERYHRLGLKAEHPSLVVSMSGSDFLGWPVRDARGRGEIAFFTSREAADFAVLTVRREARAEGIDA